MNCESDESRALSTVAADAVEIALIAALDENGLIGAAGGMPWHLPADLKYFKRMTTGKPILMGRRTHESIGRALPRRRNLVLTRARAYDAPGCECVASLDEARVRVARAGATQLVVIGGAQVYAQALAQARHLYLTRVHARFSGDTWFPHVDWSQWRQVAYEPHAADAEAGTPAYTFMQWQR